MPSREQERRINADKTSYAPTHDDATVATLADLPARLRYEASGFTNAVPGELAREAADAIEHLRGELHIVAKFLRDCGYSSTKEGEQLEELYQKIRKHEVC